MTGRLAVAGAVSPWLRVTSSAGDSQAWVPALGRGSGGRPERGMLWLGRRQLPTEEAAVTESRVSPRWRDGPLAAGGEARNSGLEGGGSPAALCVGRSRLQVQHQRRMAQSGQEGPEPDPRAVAWGAGRGVCVCVWGDAGCVRA